jgi:ankyrin repeat protein
LKKTPLHIAAEMDFVNIVETLIEFGSDPNIRDFDESTPLHCAAEQGSLKSVEFLLQKTNSDMNAKNKFGYTPSDIAQNLTVR